VNQLLEHFEAAERIDLRSEPMALQRLKDAAEKAKCDLSQSLQTEVNLPFIASDANGRATCRWCWRAEARTAGGRHRRSHDGDREAVPERRGADPPQVDQ